jgi:hypothetical protein
MWTIESLIKLSTCFTYIISCNLVGKIDQKWIIALQKYNCHKNKIWDANPRRQCSPRPQPEERSKKGKPEMGWASIKERVIVSRHIDLRFQVENSTCKRQRDMSWHVKFRGLQEHWVRRGLGSWLSTSVLLLNNFMTLGHWSYMVLSFLSMKWAGWTMLNPTQRAVLIFYNSRTS